MLFTHVSCEKNANGEFRYGGVMIEFERSFFSGRNFSKRMEYWSDFPFMLIPG
jgi:hypothetical protein